MSTLGPALLAHDVRLSGRLQDLGTRSSLLRALAIPLARSGDGWIWVVLTALIALVGDPPTRRQALVVAAAILATGIAVKVGKTLTRRGRPEGDWGGSYRRGDPHGFPSGHSARAMLLAVLASTLGPTWVGVVFLVWAVLVATSRVALGVHYLSDVVGGAALGLVCGLVARTCLV